MLSFTYDCGVLGGGAAHSAGRRSPLWTCPWRCPPDCPAPWTPRTTSAPWATPSSTTPLTTPSTRPGTPATSPCRKPGTAGAFPPPWTPTSRWPTCAIWTTTNLCILSTHGPTTPTPPAGCSSRCAPPVLLLREESSFWDDLRYGFDLLTHRVIKVNGNYCVTPDFFSAAYRTASWRAPWSFPRPASSSAQQTSWICPCPTPCWTAGARAVVGFVNNVYAVYSRNMLWGTVNQLIMGQNILQAVDAAAATYGPDDIYWYLSQGGTKPHRYAAFALVHGDDTATLLHPGPKRGGVTIATFPCFILYLMRQGWFPCRILRCFEVLPWLNSSPALPSRPPRWAAAWPRCCRAGRSSPYRRAGGRQDRLLPGPGRRAGLHRPGQQPHLCHRQLLPRAPAHGPL